MTMSAFFFLFLAEAQIGQQLPHVRCENKSGHFSEAGEVMHTKLVQIEKSTQWLYGQLLIKVQDVACDLFPQRAIVYEKVLRKNGLPVKYSLQ